MTDKRSSPSQPTPAEERQADLGGAHQAGEPQTDRAGGAPEGRGGLDADSPSPDGATPGAGPVRPTEKTSDVPRVRRSGDGAAGQSSF